MSGTAWPVTLSDVLIALGILLLMFEVIKGARPGAKYFMDHLLALLVFAGAAAEFVLLPQFGTSTYFLLTMLALIDFMCGIALRVRRQARLGPAETPARGRRARDVAAAEPLPEPSPVPPAAAASSVPPAASGADRFQWGHRLAGAGSGAARTGRNACSRKAGAGCRRRGATSGAVSSPACSCSLVRAACGFRR